MFRVLTALLMIVILTGCASIQKAQTKLQDFTVADAQRAGEIATLAGDQDGIACAKALETWVAAKPSVSALAPKGAASAFMLARELRRGADSGIPDYVHRACAVVAVDAAGTVAKLGLSVAPIPGLKALLPILPK